MTEIPTTEIFHCVENIMWNNKRKGSKCWLPGQRIIWYRLSTLFWIDILYTITRQQILDTSKLKEFAYYNLKFDKNGRNLSKQVENTVGKGEIARYEQFLLFPHCFPKGCFPGASNGVIVWEWVNSLPNNFGLVQMQSICRQYIKCLLKWWFLFFQGRNHNGKRRKCCLPAFSPFRTMFPTDCFEGC